MLIHKDIAKEALVAIKNKLDEKDVTLVGDSKAREIIPDMEKATDADWATEYLDYKMSVKIVDSVEEAIDHIYKYSTGHSECIVTENAGTAEKFMNQVDSAAVYLNARQDLQMVESLVSVQKSEFLHRNFMQEDQSVCLSCSHLSIRYTVMDR